MHDASPRPGRALVTTLLAALLGSACQAAATSSPAATPTSTLPTSAAPSPSLSPGRMPTPEPSGIAATEVTGSPRELAPGRYAHRGFVPRITFQLDGPWHSVNALSGFFDVQQLVGSPDVIAVQFGRPDQVYAAPDQPAGATTAQAAATALQHNSRLTVVESSSPEIGGLTGYQVTVENPAGMTGDAQVVHVPPGALSISPGRRLQVAFVDTPDGLLAIMVGGSVAKWAAAQAAAAPVLASVTLGE